MKARSTISTTAIFALTALSGSALETSAFGQHMRFFPVRSAPLGSPVGTVGDPVTPSFNPGTGCWEVLVLRGSEVHLELQAFGWGNAVGSPTLGAIQGTVVSDGYDNDADGPFGNLNPKGWPARPDDGVYLAGSTCQSGGDGAPCSHPFDITCGSGANGFCQINPDWIMPFCASALSLIATASLNYEWATGANSDCNVDLGFVKTLGGLILEVPVDADGSYIIAVNPDPNNSFMRTGLGVPIPGVAFTSACITIVNGPPCCLPDGSCTDLTTEDCEAGGGQEVCECRGDDDMNGVNDACEADCDADGTLDTVELANCPPGNPSCDDCNSNCIPDVCDLTGNDCNGNGIPDECDLTDNDCNNNGIPDECDLTGNDCNNNGVPDECDLTGNDCNSNGVPDDCDIDPSDPDGNGEVSGDNDADGVINECDNCPDVPNPGQDDQNDDGIGDACSGACCFVLDGRPSCVDTAEVDCAALPGVTGIFQGLGTVCPTEGVGTQIHLGVVVTHVVDPAQLCGDGGGRAICNPGDPIDPWQTALDADICHQFGVGPESPAIPADFFGSGSDPFTGQICLAGTPLGLTPEGEFGDADTLVRRTGGPAGTGDPFERCELPSAKEVTVNAEVIALSLQSVAPIIVTFNGGQNPESWDVVVGLSSVTPPPGTITAVKSHCNGGTYNSELHVQPKFTFTKVSDPNTSEALDTGLAGIPFVTLTQDTDPHWTNEVSETLGLPSPICTDFHPGIEDTQPTVDCDCNANQIRDVCEIESPSLPLTPHDILKNRYISIDPRGECGANAGKDLNIHLTLTSTLVNGTTGPAVGSQWWANAPDGNCISLVGPTQPATPPSWAGCDVLHLTGCAIIPTSTYDIIVIDEQGTPSPTALSAVTQSKPADEKWYGDSVGNFTGIMGNPPNVWTAPQGVANFDDVNACLKTFLDPNGVSATHTSVSDIHPLRPDLGGLDVHPNKLVNGNDIFFFIQGFKGEEFPGGDLASCTDP